MTPLAKVLAPLAIALGAAAAVAISEVAAAQPPGPGARPPSDPDSQPPFGKGGQPPFGGKGGKFGKGDQPPFGKGFPGKGDGRKRPDDKKGDDGAGADATVEAWLRVLIDKITDPHDTVRDSARGAVVAVGRPAVPALRRLADGTDPAKAVAARKLIQTIEERRGRGPEGGPGRGGSPVGFGGFGGPGGFGPPVAPFPGTPRRPGGGE